MCGSISGAGFAFGLYVGSGKPQVATAGSAKLGEVKLIRSDNSQRAAAAAVAQGRSRRREPPRDWTAVPPPTLLMMPTF